jgi:hypothetical protein
MQLRDHPLMSYRQFSTWPPVWMWIGGTEDRHPKGEVGTLRRVKVVDGHPTVHKCFMWMEYEGGEYLTCLLLDDASFCEQLCTLLQQNIGRSIEEIGGLDLSYLT